MALEPLTMANLAVITVGLIAFRAVGKADREKGTFRSVLRRRLTVDAIKPWMMIVVSLAVLGCSLYIIVSGKYDADNQKFASGFIGTIIGFWLRP